MNKILIIDDDKALLNALAGTLEKASFQVKALTDAKCMYEIIKSFSPELIVLDILLAEEDGRDICLELKENPVTSYIKIILYSAFHDTEDNYEQYGADGFILKPFHSNHLIEAIKFHLDTAVMADS